MLISIIIPVYNVELYIIRCLQSVVAQSDKVDIEVLLVDDCGTDNSIQLAESFLKEHKGLDYRILYHSQNRGLSAARNTGLRAAKGDYVYLLDSDDALLEGALSELSEPLKTGQYDVVIGNYITEPSKEEMSMLLLPKGEVMGNERILRSYAKGLWYVMAWNKLCRRDFLIDNNLFFEEGLLHEDVIWSFMVACKAKSMYIVKCPTYIYSIRQASIMTGMSIEKDVSIYVKAFDKIREFIKLEHLETGRDEYLVFQGKRAGILYSLLQKDECSLFGKYYPMFHRQCYLSPWRAYCMKLISVGYLIRDFHYMLPVILGKLYMRLFYLLCYKLRGKKIEGAVWG